MPIVNPFTESVVCMEHAYTIFRFTGLFVLEITASDPTDCKTFCKVGFSEMTSIFLLRLLYDVTIAT